MRYHIVGIAGAGMSAIAHILLDQGHMVSGSDAQRNAAVDALERRGVRFWRGHDPAQLPQVDAVVATSAVKPDHVELAAARERGIPVLKRADLWREWSQQRAVIAVAGTHGKTTTTAMLALILTRAGIDPGFIIGGDAPNLGVSARWGSAEAPLVIEADEYDRTFLSLAPRIAIITNVEWDHVDIYSTPADYTAAFQAFAASVSQSSNVIICGDDPGAEQLDAPGATYYGIDEGIERDPVSCRRALLHWMASGIRADERGTHFNLWRYDPRTFATRRLGEQALKLHGEHNVRNALAATAAATLLGVDSATITAALAEYSGTGRRFEIKGEAGGVTVVDDYAHHPTEVRATLQAARARYGTRRLIAYLQPHTYSRTAALLDEWADAFGDADAVRIGDVYAARETPADGADSTTLVARIRHADVQPVGSVAQATEALLATLQPGDVLLMLGAGDGNRVGTTILETGGGTRKAGNDDTTAR